MFAAPQCPVYAITDCENLQEAALFARVEALLDAGCRWLQYRDKLADGATQLGRARALRALCHRHSARLIINDHIELARQAGADGVHLGQGDGTVAEARRQLGAGAVVGVTCHQRLDLATAAVSAGASYLAFGRFYASRTKPEAPVASPALLAEARRRWPRQTLVAIGGITRDNATPLLAAGADLVAICHAVFHATDPAAYCSALSAPPAQTEDTCV